MCQEYGLLNFMIQNICKHRTEVISVFEQTGLRIKDLENLNEVMLMMRFKQCVSGRNGMKICKIEE